MISYLQAIILGLLQGVSELFPISSLGHSVIFPQLFGWNIHQQDPYFLAFLVATHLATALVLVGFFWKDWVLVIKGMGQSLAARDISTGNIYGKLGWLLVVGTIPAAIIGLLFQDSLQKLFASAQLTAFVLILNGGLLYLAEFLRKKAVNQTEEGSDERLANVSWSQSLMVGAAQALALIPGFSRSGASMAGGLFIGLSNEDAARFSFLMATPIIAAAALLKLPELFAPANHDILGQTLVGALCAGFTAYLAVRFLVRFFQTNRLTPFATYCVVAGVIFSVILLFR